MEARLGFHGFWFGGGVIASIVTGSAFPIFAVLVCSIAIESLCKQ